MIRLLVLVTTLAVITCDERIMKCDDSRNPVNIESTEALPDSPIAVRPGKRIQFSVQGEALEDISAEENLRAEAEIDTHWWLLGWKSVCGLVAGGCKKEFNCTDLQNHSKAPKECPVKAGKFNENLEVVIPPFSGFLAFFASGSYRVKMARVFAGEKLIGCAKFDNLIFEI